MKKASVLIIVVSVLFIGLVSFINAVNGKIKGNIVPVDGGIQVWALNMTDTLRANIVGGAFEFAEVKPGVYNVFIETKPEYAPYVKGEVLVAEGQTVDLGNIQLERKPKK